MSIYCRNKRSELGEFEKGVKLRKKWLRIVNDADSSMAKRVNGEIRYITPTWHSWYRH